ncbi:2TM domain-containing protein [Flavobacterium sp. SM2513]|uniref:2TM domain-containing protein n=1 Tax=Flavobacterium sp. SM2513 TaxID=3424766 RepID=UPI003D7F4276
MEINPTKILSEAEMHYQKAKKKAREIRSFYINLGLFCVLIPVIIGINLSFVPQFHWFWLSILGWGTGLAFHGLATFNFRPFVNSNWEQRKIQQFIKEDLEREQAAKYFEEQ